MKIGILQTGEVPQELAADHSDYDARFRVLLDGHGFEFTTYRVLDGEFPASVTEQDGWIITGSKFGVYEDHPWIAPLEDLIRRISAAGQKLLGICFGHQIIAQALGGKVAKAKEGWMIGATRYRTGGEDVVLNAWHQDQIVELPERAEVLATAEGCKFAALAYGDQILTWQPHPEYDGSFIEGLLQVRGALLPEDVKARISANPEKANGNARLADEISAFFLSEAASGVSS